MFGRYLGISKLLLLIPLMLIGLLISKLLPVYFLKIWYDKNTVIASSFLLTSTLSLVIAAATIGERMGVITKEMSGTFILVAVITSVFTPIVFKKVFPFETEKYEENKDCFYRSKPVYLTCVYRTEIRCL